MLVRRMATVTISAPAGVDRRPGLGEIPVLAGTDEQAGTVGLAGDRQAVE
jgi:hypothetical protein